jgi:hypothetical protein
VKLLAGFFQQAFEGKRMVGDVSQGPAQVIVEIVYLRSVALLPRQLSSLTQFWSPPGMAPLFFQRVRSDSIEEGALSELSEAWKSQGKLHYVPASPKPFTFRRKSPSYNPSKDERALLLPKWALENEAAGYGKPKPEKKAAGKKGKGKKK